MAGLLAGLAACGSSGEQAGACLPVDDAVLDLIASRPVPQVAGELEMRRGAAVVAADHGSGYIVSAVFRAKGVETGIGSWWLDTLDADAGSVLWAAPFADQFTEWPAAGALTPPIMRDSPDVLAAEVCVTSAG